MRKNFKEAFIMFIVQIISYTLISINYRAIAQANYIFTGVSDLMMATISYFIIRKIANTKNATAQWIGFTLGGVIGSFAGIYISKLLLGN